MDPSNNELSKVLDSANWDELTIMSHIEYLLVRKDYLLRENDQFGKLPIDYFTKRCYDINYNPASSTQILNMMMNSYSNTPFMMSVQHLNTICSCMIAWTTAYNNGNISRQNLSHSERFIDLCTFIRILENHVVFHENPDDKLFENIVCTMFLISKGLFDVNWTVTIVFGGAFKKYFGESFVINYFREHKDDRLLKWYYSYTLFGGGHANLQISRIIDEIIDFNGIDMTFSLALCLNQRSTNDALIILIGHRDGKIKLDFGKLTIEADSSSSNGMEMFLTCIVFEKFQNVDLKTLETIVDLLKVNGHVLQNDFSLLYYSVSQHDNFPLDVRFNLVTRAMSNEGIDGINMLSNLMESFVHGYQMARNTNEWPFTNNHHFNFDVSNVLFAHITHFIDSNLHRFRPFTNDQAQIVYRNLTSPLSKSILMRSNVFRDAANRMVHYLFSRGFDYIIVQDNIVVQDFDETEVEMLLPALVHELIRNGSFRSGINNPLHIDIVNQFASVQAAIMTVLTTGGLYVLPSDVSDIVCEYVSMHQLNDKKRKAASVSSLEEEEERSSKRQK